MIKNYENLIVWQKAVELAVEIYSLTELFPKSEIYGVTSQMRRSAVSIASNIAEGSRRSSKKDFRNFLFNAFGSGAELETQIIITKQLSFAKEEFYDKSDSLLQEIMKMLNKLIKGMAA